MLALLPLALLCELFALVMRQPALSVTSGILLTAFFVWHWRSLMPYPSRLGLVTLALLAYWLLSGEASWPQVQRMLASAAYYGAFVGANPEADHHPLGRVPPMTCQHEAMKFNRSVAGIFGCGLWHCITFTLNIRMPGRMRARRVCILIR